MTASASTAGGGRAPGAATSLERISWIVALDGFPVRRNLLITQAYHDLSTALSQALGSPHANWCTFATWASRCAGGFVRGDEVPARFRAQLGQMELTRLALARTAQALSRVQAAATIDAEGIIEILHQVVLDVSALITAGNLTVFAELAPVFSRALDAFAADEGPAALDLLAQTLKPGLTERGGQSLLQGALRHYAVARVEPGAHKKAALMLLANAQTGLHEQIRLQPFIAGAIDAPLRDALYDTLEESGAHLPSPLQHEAHALASHLVHPLADAAEKLWEECMTRFAMTLPLPEGPLMLGRKLPPPRGAPLYPTELDPIANEETAEFLLHYGAHRPHSRTHGAADWARLTDRMRYILDLFRSRHCDNSLMNPPFTPNQQEALLAGHNVPGPL